MFNIYHYPTNAGELLGIDNAFRRHFTLIAEVTWQDQKIFITINPTSPIAVSNPRTQSLIYQETGVKLILRKEMSVFSHDNHYLLGAGTLFELCRGKEHFMPLLQRDMNAPSNPGKWTNPSGLCSSHPVASAQAELAEELGIVELSQDEQSLKILISLFEEKTEDTEYWEYLYNYKQSQEMYIREALDPAYRKLPINYALLPTTILPILSHSLKIFLRMPTDDDYYRIPCFVSFDESSKSLTLNMRCKASLATENNYFIVDAEIFKRNVALATRDSLSTFPCTYALEMLKQSGICFS